MDSRTDRSLSATGGFQGEAIVLDTETTGVSIGHDELLSIAIVDYDGGTLLHTLIRPSRHTRWPSAQQINGISPQMVQSAPCLEDVAPRIQEYVDDSHLVVAYNADFDLGMLVSLHAIPHYPHHVFDVMKQYAQLHGIAKSRYGNRYRWSRLSECARHYGYEFHAHDALEDARATAYCFRALLDEMS